jgi:hypothetical protein
MPAVSRGELEELVAAVDDLIETRDAIVHGMLTATHETGSLLFSHRPPRSQNPPMIVYPRCPNQPVPEWKVRTFSREVLVEFRDGVPRPMGHDSDRIRSVVR